jgi:hypothetical protein
MVRHRLTPTQVYELLEGVVTVHDDEKVNEVLAAHGVRHIFVGGKLRGPEPELPL